MTGIVLRAPSGRPYAVGHRGAMGHAPENTLVGHLSRGLAFR